MKFPKISTKTIAATASSLLLVASGIVIYNVIQDRQIENTWFDSNWIYRKAIYLDIPAEFRGIEQDVLLEIDTASLISSGKLLNNCNDLRFLDEDNQTQLKYWIEGGCNTTRTQVWIQVPSLIKSTKTIYSYYGNNSAPDAQEEWVGEFISLSLDTCESNWTDREAFDGKFVLGSTRYGDIGGNPTHDHQLFDVFQSSNCLEPLNVSATRNIESCDTEKDNIVNLFTTSHSNIPEHEDVNFCGSRDGFLTSSSVMLYDDITPQGWLHIEELNGKYPRGEDGMEIEASSFHTHSARCTNTDLKSTYPIEGYLTLTGTSRTIVLDTEPPYYNVNFVRNSNGGPILSNGIMMVTTLPPLGWTRYEEMDNFMPKGSVDDFKSTGGISMHDHIPNMQVLAKKTAFANIQPLNPTKVCMFDYNNNVTKTLESSTLPPYISMVFAKKKTWLTQSIVKEIGEEQKVPSTNTSTAENTENQVPQKPDDGLVLGEFEYTPTAPTDLLTEGQTNPTMVNTQTPAFSAIFHHPDANQ